MKVSSFQFGKQWIFILNNWICFDANFQYSFNLDICMLVHSVFSSQRGEFDTYLSLNRKQEPYYSRWKNWWLIKLESSYWIVFYLIQVNRIIWYEVLPTFRCCQPQRSHFLLTPRTLKAKCAYSFGGRNRDSVITDSSGKKNVKL